MHHKIMLVDNDISVVGTANMDNRSFRLNFEVSQIIVDRGFAQQMEAMFLDDFRHTTMIDPRGLEQEPFLKRLAVRVARLTAPVL